MLYRLRHIHFVQSKRDVLSKHDKLPSCILFKVFLREANQLFNLELQRLWPHQGASWTPQFFDWRWIDSTLPESCPWAQGQDRCLRKIAGMYSRCSFVRTLGHDHSRSWILRLVDFGKSQILFSFSSSPGQVRDSGMASPKRFQYVKILSKSTRLL